MGLLIAVGELQKHATFRNHFFAFFQPAPYLDVVVLLGAHRYRPPRELAWLDFHIYKRFILLIAQDGRNRNRQTFFSVLVWITASTYMSFLSRSPRLRVTMRTGVVRVSGSTIAPTYETIP